MQNTLAVISLKTILQNAEAVRRCADRPLIAVVKDDAYGHGAVRVSLALEPYVSGFAVSTVSEGEELRAAGVSKDILVLTPPLCEEEVLRLAASRLTASLTCLAVLNLVRSVQEKYAVGITAHLAVNTGMNRYGFRPELVNDALLRTEGMNVTGVYSHLYLPESAKDRAAQARIFGRACEQVRSVYPDAVRHLAATGGAIAGVPSDAVRAGIALYGYLPEAFRGKIQVKPAAKLYATVAQSGTQLGGGMGYARAKHGGGKCHTLRLGYGDGLFRAGGLGAEGKLCMDACVRRGGARTFGRRLVLSDVTKYAKEHGTTEYEVLVNFLRKADKRYE